MEEDKEDEAGDHGSIVAFRIPCRPSSFPSVDFQPPSSPSFAPSTTTGRTCNSPPPFVPPSSRLLLLSSPRVIPQTSLPHSTPLAQSSQTSTTYTYVYLQRASRIADVQYASLRRLRPTETRHTTRPSSSIAHSLLSLSYSLSLSSLFSAFPVFTRLRVSHLSFPPFRALRFRHLFFSLSLSPSLVSSFLSSPLPPPATAVAVQSASSRRRAKLAWRRVGQWRE